MSYILFLEEQLCTHRVVRLMWLCIYTIFQFSPAACLRTQRQAVRVTLKELESLSFDINSADAIKQLHSDLESLKKKFQQSTSTENGLVLRTQATCSRDRARKLKLTYKQLRQRMAPYDSLYTKQQSGRPRSDYRYRNRVGKKATTLRKGI